MGAASHPSNLPSPPNARPWAAGHEPTPFQAAVVEAVRAVAPGDVVTYADLAHAIGRPGAEQAIANVLRCAPDVPWWRVLPSTGRMYRTHAPLQALMLEREGHQIGPNREINP